MPTNSFTIAALNDEGSEEVTQGNSGGVWSALVIPGSVTGPATDYHSGFRWLAVGTSIPQGATINTATLKLRARGPNTGTLANIHLRFYGVNIDSALDWASTTVVPTLVAKTTAFLNYDPSVFVTDDYYNYDVTSMVQEIVNRPGFASGSALAIVLMNNGTTGDNALNYYRQNDGDTESGKLTIDWSPGGPSVRPFVTVIGAKRI